jgi:hypothetical protein
VSWTKTWTLGAIVSFLSFGLPSAPHTGPWSGFQLCGRPRCLAAFYLLCRPPLGAWTCSERGLRIVSPSGIAQVTDELAIGAEKTAIGMLMAGPANAVVRVVHRDARLPGRGKLK